MKKLFFLIFILLFFTPVHGRETLGVWIAAVDNMDWPSKQGLTAKEQQKELITMFDGLRDLGFNAIYFQVRPTADTFWPSKLEPWSHWLTGEQGKSPGWNPLAFAVREAHKRGMKIHAWINPFRITKNKGETFVKTHPAVKNPSWVIEYDGRFYYDPGNPQARAHTLRVVKEILDNYKVDGIHMDDYFYPYPASENKKIVPFPDEASFKKYAKKGQSLADWRRENVNNFVIELRNLVKKTNPKLEYGISPFGVWCNEKDCEGGSKTNALNSYGDIYADTRLWAREGYVDYIIPQLYWHMGHKAAPFAPLLDWWSNEVDAVESRPALYIGIGAHQYGKNAAWKADEIPNQINLSRQKPAVDGFVYFNASRVLADEEIGGMLRSLHPKK